MPEMPHPSSKMVDELVSIWDEKRKLVGGASQLAMRGVIFQTTEEV